MVRSSESTGPKETSGPWIRVHAVKQPNLNQRLRPRRRPQKRK